MMPDSQPASQSGQIFQINISSGGVPKRAVLRGLITTSGVDGDMQANLDVHGGIERAVCLYSLERITALQAEGHPIFPGSAGENLTLSNLDWDLIVPGICIALGTDVLLEITRYTSPCKTIAASFLDQDFSRISQKIYPGWSRVYARVLKSGVVEPGDAAQVLLPENRG
jgi:MOSC domain-containing protein YiiM